MKRLGDVINVLCPKIFGKKWAMLQALMVHWQGIVGSDMAKISKPIDINLSTGSRNLIIAVSNNCHVLELQMKQKQIADQVMRYIGSRAEGISIKFVLNTSWFDTSPSYVSAQNRPHGRYNSRHGQQYNDNSDFLRGGSYDDDNYAGPIKKHAIEKKKKEYSEEERGVIIASYMKGIDDIEDLEMRAVMRELAELCIKDELNRIK